MNRYLKVMILTIGIMVYSQSWGWYGLQLPIYADAAVSHSSTGPWYMTGNDVQETVSVCTDTRLYFRAQSMWGNLAPLQEEDCPKDMVMENLSYTWSFGDGTNTVSGREASHQFVTTTASSYWVQLTVDDEGVFEDDPMAKDSARINITPVVNPMVTSNTYQYDLTHQLPFCGTFAFGTIGGYVSCSAGGSVTSNLGNVQLNVSSAGGSSEINLLHDTPIDLRKTTFPVDVVNVLVQFRTSPEVCSGGEFEVFVSGDTTTHKLPVRSSIKFGAQNSYIQPAGKTDYMIFVLNVLPQDFTKLNELVIRYTTPGGVESYINLEQVYLWVERRYL